MLNEIDKDFYCSADAYHHNSGMCLLGGKYMCNMWPLCHNKHRKWPTPEQYKKEYSKEYPENGAVYVSNSGWGFMVENYAMAKGRITNVPRTKIVCACTPWGKPPDDWRS